MDIVIEAASGAEVVVAGRRLTSFAGCDYLGLARDPEVTAAARAARLTHGGGAGASRTTTGTARPHLELEAALARFAGTEDAVALASGWLAAQSLAAALGADARAAAGTHDARPALRIRGARAARRDADVSVALLDAGAHPALRDAARLSGLPVREYAHFDPAAAVRAAAGDAPLVLTDSVDLACGTVAPLRRLRTLVERSGGHVIVDDAHGVGVLGPGGRGAVAWRGAESPRVHVAGSLSKAFGTHGGFVAGTRELCRAVRTCAASYAGATPIPPAIAAAATVAVRRAAESDTERRRLHRNARRLRARLAALGLRVPAPGLPWFVVDGLPAARLSGISRALLAAGFLVPHLRYFGAPAGGYLKLVATAAHTRDDIERVTAALERALTSRRTRSTATARLKPGLRTRRRGTNSEPPPG